MGLIATAALPHNPQESAGDAERYAEGSSSVQTEPIGRPDDCATARLRAETLALFATAVPPGARGPGARQIRRRSARMLDNLFFALLAQTRVETLVECGAHGAQASHRFVAAGGRRAIAIEANPAVFASRTTRVLRPGVETVNVGLSDRAGEMAFHVPEGKPHAGNASFLKKGPAARTVPVTVPVTTLDLLLKDRRASGRTALWIDVEGYARQVLAGAAATLAAADTAVVKIELEDREIWQGQAPGARIGALIEAQGFVPVLCDIQYVGQYNALFLRQDLVQPCAAAIDRARRRLRRLSRSMPEDPA